MTLNLDRAAMRGQQAEAQEQRHRLRLKAEGLCTALRTQLNTALYDVEEIAIAQSAQQMDDLVTTMAELAAVQGKLARLDRELRG